MYYTKIHKSKSSIDTWSAREIAVTAKPNENKAGDRSRKVQRQQAQKTFLMKSSKFATKVMACY